MLTQNLGYPRIGSQRELKKICENYWADKTGYKNVLQVGKNIRHENWNLQKEAGIDVIPSNDFSFYDHVLDHSLTFGAIPKRYNEVILKKGNSELDLYFAMARGYQKEGLDVVAMEMTKWFDTNYHYIVPEFYKDQPFKLFSTKIIDEFYEAKQLGIATKPVLIGPVSYLLLGKEKEAGFEKIDLIKNLLPVYIEILSRLDALDVEYVQFDEPFLTLDLTEKDKKAYEYAYKEIRKAFPRLKIVLATYFEGLGNNLALTTSLPVNILHIDLVRAEGQLADVLALLKEDTILSLGLVDGRNIWKNDFEKSVSIINQVAEKRGLDKVWIAPSCSLIHSPVDLDIETNEQNLSAEIKQWLAYAKQKIAEIATLKKLITNESPASTLQKLEENKIAIANRKVSKIIHNPEVKQRVLGLKEQDAERLSPFSSRKIKQQELNLPSYATTTIGSFPQTAEVRSWRAKLKNGTFTVEEYDDLIAKETAKAVNWQEEIDLDVLVHGEFERNDMVEYFGEQLDGFAFSKNGWVQSYGSRCVKPTYYFW
ncbi:5-methyltetrahydropteroyltriglutamate--homocysteine S-methyltransferase [Pedobacter sp. W3I1]|uniref:5-methyltetrahydropteroyltriglutamate-- homocysteine S-methyltransferase n=1 Tax=Pedobacter sp. W3I1 TaxID=3042291 RepID=UPI002786EB71|nr:5-methyltetrahydropteroyltriglutamate--homocysteine S-methyltransferase [Pedobacter sp. W3I1]